jgi:tryptophan synthase beta chain
MLYPNVEELRQEYLKITLNLVLKRSLIKLLKDYVGRPSPLYFATDCLQYKNLLKEKI